MVGLGGGAYNPPSAKIEMRATLCFFGSSSAANAGIGIIRIARSVAMCIDALENHSPFELRQVPGTVGSQNRATGTQFRNALRTAHVPYVASKAIMIQQV